MLTTMETGDLWDSKEFSANPCDITGKEFKGFVSDPNTGQHRATSIIFDPVKHVGGGTLYLNLETNTPDTDQINTINANTIDGRLLFAEIENHNEVMAPNASHIFWIK